MEHRLHVVDRTGTNLALLPDVEVDKVSWELNGSGDLSFTLDPLLPEALKILLMKTEIQLWLRDPLADPPLANWLAWWGIPMNVEGDQDGLTFTCEGLLSYFKYRMIDTGSKLYTSIEQFNIVKDLIEYCQTGTGRDLNIDVAAYVASGRLRSRNYSRWEHESIYEIMEEFPKLDGGFDYDIAIFGDGRREWTPYYPRKGVNRPNLRLEWGKNLKKYRYRESGVEMANQVYVSGGSSGDVKFEQNWTDTAARDDYGLFQAVVSEGQQKDVAWLLDKAKREVGDRKAPIITPELTAVQLPVRYLGTVATGDTFPVKIDHGRIQIDGSYRINKIAWDPGSEDLDIGVELAA